jgi:hypothetical protein
VAFVEDEPLSPSDEARDEEKEEKRGVALETLWRKRKGFLFL